MKKIILGIFLTLLMVSSVWAADCETITVATAAIGFTTATYQPPVGYKQVEAYCCNETAQIRGWYDNDTDPTSAIGIIIDVGDCFWVRNNDDIPYFKAIRTGGSSGSLTCCYSFSK